MFLYLTLFIISFCLLGYIIRRWRKPAAGDSPYSGQGGVDEELKDRVRRFSTDYDAAHSPEVMEINLIKWKNSELATIYAEVIQAYEKGEITKVQFDDLRQKIEEEIDISFLHES